MKTTKFPFGITAALAAVLLAGCNGSKSPDVVGAIRKSLDDAGIKHVSVSQDRDKGVVTLGGDVKTDAEKAQAESLARSLAADQVVADQIAVLPRGGESDAKAVNSDIDKAIEKNLDAALIQNKMHKQVSYAVKNGVVTLTGDVDTPFTRNQAQQVAAAIPNVSQVVNNLQVKNQKATSSR